MASSGSAEFDALKAHLDSRRDVVRELEFAFTSLLAAANPSDRGARFAFGGGAEWIMAAAAWSAGILTAPGGHNANGFDLTDLLDNARGLWSVKASASNKSYSIRLVNFMGDGKDAAWDVPTLFVGPYLGGAVFVDPQIEADIRSRTKSAGDALTLSAREVQKFGESHPQNCIAFDVAVNNGQGQGDPFALIKAILTPQHFPNLSKPFMAAEPPSAATRVNDLQALVSLKDEGVIDSDQLQVLVNRFVAS